MAIVDEKLEGVVSEVGMERDENEFHNFNLTVGIQLKTNRKLNLGDCEKLIKQLRKDLLGKNIELEPIAVPCPVCGKTFNSELGMKQHFRILHDNQEELTNKEGRNKKSKSEKGSNNGDTNKKKASSKRLSKKSD
jgi:hypothetical protein